MPVFVSTQLTRARGPSHYVDGLTFWLCRLASHEVAFVQSRDRPHEGKTLDFQSSALPTELPSRFARENMRNNNQLHNHDRMTSAGH